MKVHHEKKSEGVKVHHEKERWGGSSPKERAMGREFTMRKSDAVRPSESETLRLESAMG